MIVGNLNALPLAGLPPALGQILQRPDCSLAALLAREDGRFQPPGAAWFCNVGVAHTQPAEQRHTEYHRQWADIQVILDGAEIIHAGMQDQSAPGDEERKPDLFIAAQAPTGVALRVPASAPP